MPYKAIGKRLPVILPSFLCIVLCVLLIVLYSDSMQRRVSIDSFKELQSEAEARNYDYWGMVLVVDSVSEILSPSASELLDFVLVPDRDDVTCWKGSKTDVRRVVYTVKEEFPAAKTRQVFEGYLLESGWHRLEFSFFWPEVKFLQQWLSITMTSEDTVRRWREKWVSKDDEVLTVLFDYAEDKKGQIEGNRVKITQLYCREFEQRGLERYKELHQDEFDSESTRMECGDLKLPAN